MESLHRILLVAKVSSLLPSHTNSCEVTVSSSIINPDMNQCTTRLLM